MENVFLGVLARILLRAQGMGEICCRFTRCEPGHILDANLLVSRGSSRGRGSPLSAESAAGGRYAYAHALHEPHSVLAAAFIVGDPRLMRHCEFGRFPGVASKLTLKS